MEGEERELAAGEIARVAPKVRRQLVNRDPAEDCLLLALGGANEHVGRDGEAFDAWDQETGAPPQQVPLPDASRLIEHVDTLPAGLARHDGFGAGERPRRGGHRVARCRVSPPGPPF